MNTNKKILIAVLLAVAAIAIYFVTRDNNQIPQEEVLTEVIVSRPDINFEFTYKIGLDGYSLSEAPRDASSTDPLLNGFVLKPVQLEETPTTAQGEPVISIFVLEEPDEKVVVSTGTTTKPEKIDSLKALALQYKNISGYENESDAEIVNIDGVSVLHYTAEGLYTHDTYFANVFGKIYLITGQYNNDGEKIHQDFIELVNSISFL